MNGKREDGNILYSSECPSEETKFDIGLRRLSSMALDLERVMDSSWV
jgi:hypothetical protein